MSRRSFPLEAIQVASPCDVSWDEMKGSDRVRFCGQCQKNVYNLSAMSRWEADELIEQREGHLCVRLYKREDGTVLTEDCPVGLRAARRKVALLVGGVAAGVLLLVGWSAAFVGLVVSKTGFWQPRPIGTGNPIIIQPPQNQVIMGEICPPNLPPPIENPPDVIVPEPEPPGRQ